MPINRPHQPAQPRVRSHHDGLPNNLSLSRLRIRDLARMQHEAISDPRELSRQPSPVDPSRLLPSCTESMRAYLHTQRLQLREPWLERFLRHVFDDGLTVEAYFEPRLVPVGLTPANTTRQVMLPVEAALKAAQRARNMALHYEMPHEQELAYVAALVYPSGLFHCLHPHVETNTGLRDLSHGRPDGVRGHLLEWPLHLLRVKNEPMANTLAAVLQRGICEAVDAEQVSRISTSAHLANRQILRMWTY